MSSHPAVSPLNSALHVTAPEAASVDISHEDTRAGSGDDDERAQHERDRCPAGTHSDCVSPLHGSSAGSSSTDLAHVGAQERGAGSGDDDEHMLRKRGGHSAGSSSGRGPDEAWMDLCDEDENEEAAHSHDGDQEPSSEIPLDDESAVVGSADADEGRAGLDEDENRDCLLDE